MLRLSSPGNEKLFQSPQLRTHFGGGEANVSVSLANFGLNSRFITALPSNPIGKAIIQYLKGFEVDTSSIIIQGNRVGIYFLETGSGPRPSSVIYDRSNSAISEAKKEDFVWDQIFDDAKWFHITGITPALSQNSADLAIFAVKEAKDRGLTVSCDLNYRSKLWKYGKKPHEIMRELVKSVDIIIANEEDIQKTLDYPSDQKIGGIELQHEKFKELIYRVVQDFPNVSNIAITLRESFSADYNDWSAILYEKESNKLLKSEKYSLRNIIDRVGGGDSFSAGLIYGLSKYEDKKDALNFAVAASALKHTIPGDMNLVSLTEVKNLMKGDSHGRVQR